MKTLTNNAVKDVVDELGLPGLAVYLLKVIEEISIGYGLKGFTLNELRHIPDKEIQSEQFISLCDRIDESFAQFDQTHDEHYFAHDRVQNFVSKIIGIQHFMYRNKLVKLLKSSGNAHTEEVMLKAGLEHVYGGYWQHHHPDESPI